MALVQKTIIKNDGFVKYQHENARNVIQNAELILQDGFFSADSGCIFTENIFKITYYVVMGYAKQII